MNNRFGRDTWVVVTNRKVKLCDDLKTQSVNICTALNAEGVYEQVFYFRGSFRVSEDQITLFTNLEELTAWLRKRSYDQLQ